MDRGSISRPRRYSGAARSAFCAGGDLGAIGKGRERNQTAELNLDSPPGCKLPKYGWMPQPVIALRTVPQPVLEQHRAAADIRIAADTATFGQNFAKVGLFPDYG